VKILLIDDEHEFCLQVKTYFESVNDTILVESNGLRAMSQFNSFKPDVVIVDIDLGLREIDGRAICAEILKSEHYGNGSVGIVLISGHYIAPSDEVLGFEIGADNYLIKPFELSQLGARIQALARRFQFGKKNSLLKSGDLEVDTSARTLSVSAQEVKLTKLEFNVLECLMIHSGEVLTKTQLLEKVWRTPHVEEGAIAKCVSILRRKMSPNEPERYIKTVHGVGYRFFQHDSPVN